MLMYKQVIVLRTDLNMRKGKMVAQGAHASMKVVLENFEHPHVMEWLSGAFTKVVVGIDSEDALLALDRLAEELGLIHCVIVDAGLTEFHGIPTSTAVAIGPGPLEVVDQVTGKLKLL